MKASTSHGRTVYIRPVFLFSSQVCAKSYISPLSYTLCPYIMATRRISAACIAQTGRSGLLNPPRLTPRAAHALRCARTIAAPARTLSTTPRRYKQEANTKAKRDPAPTVVRGASKLFKDADSAVADLKSGSTILSAGFGLCGTAGELRRVQNPRDEMEAKSWPE